MSARAIAIQVGTALLLTIGCLWAATPWAAAMLAYQPALGAPLAEAFGCVLYAPWKLFGWWLAFDRQAPHVFNTAGLMAAAGGVASGAVALGVDAWRAGTKARSATIGSARWAALSDMRKAGLLEPNGVAFAPNDERTAKSLSDALGTTTELRAQRHLSGARLSMWLSHTSISSVSRYVFSLVRRASPRVADSMLRPVFLYCSIAGRGLSCRIFALRTVYSCSGAVACSRKQQQAHLPEQLDRACISPPWTSVGWISRSIDGCRRGFSMLQKVA